MSGIGHPQKLILLVSRGLCFEREMFGAGREQIMLEAGQGCFRTLGNMGLYRKDK